MHNIVISGASSGIGRATAIRLGGSGKRLALMARRADLLEALALEIGSRGGIAKALPLDVRETAEVESAIKSVLADWGHIDVLIANAGVRPEGRLDETEPDALRTAMDVNYFGATNLTYQVLPGMIERRAGHIIYMNSLDGRWANRLEGPYVASKHALLGFAGVARKEFGDLGIAVTSILPGRVDTPMIESLRVSPIQPKMPAERVAEAVERAIRRRPAEIVLPPFRGRLMMLLGAALPGMADRVADLLRIEGLPD